MSTALLRGFEGRLEAAVAKVKESRRFREAFDDLLALDQEANASAEIIGNAELMNKLYVNLMVCAERFDELGNAERYAESALGLKPDDPREWCWLSTQRTIWSMFITWPLSFRLIERGLVRSRAFP